MPPRTGAARTKGQRANKHSRNPEEQGHAPCACKREQKRGLLQAGRRDGAPCASTRSGGTCRIAIDKNLKSDNSYGGPRRAKIAARAAMSGTVSWSGSCARNMNSAFERSSGNEGHTVCWSGRKG